MKQEKQHIKISDFSPHLFWDTDKKKLDVDEHKSFLIQRVLEYGLMKDWKLISAYYGIKKIGETATDFRILEPKALSFISTISKIPIKNFRCYNIKQSIPKHWNF